MSDEEDDIILSELDDEELVQQMFDDLYDGLKEEIEEGVNILLERGWAPYDILTKALVGGMTIVGHDFRDGILFVPEVLLAANAMKGGMAILKPLLAETGAPKQGKMVIGTVKGDIHDIGKNLVSMMMEGAGFEVVDLGINNPVENYLETAAAEKADIVGMSALLTTTMPYMKVVIDQLKEKGIRDQIIVLVGGALALSAVYRAQTLSLLEEDLEQNLVGLTREMTREGAFLEDGQVTDSQREFFLGDVRFRTQYSGRYWAIVGVSSEGDIAGDIRSRSLWDEPVPLSDGQLDRTLANPGMTQFGDFDLVGPAGQHVRVASRAILIANRDTPLVLVAAADRAANDAAATRFRNLLLGTMIALFGGVFAAMVAGISFSLRPLRRIGDDVAEVREGTRQKLSEDYPAEVRPLADELNKLLEHNRQVVERARTHVGNLAHALKTPLAVLRNEATGDTLLDDVVRRQSENMQTNVEHYLKRAQMVARAQTLGARTELRPVIDGIARMLNRLYDARGVNVSVDGGVGAVFRGEKQDLEEMVGNLMENACKWARSEVMVRVRDGAEALTIEVEDDGKGLTQEERAGALKRGVRLDETTPGTGLGLSIVKELAELHRGSLDLGDSGMGGLKAVLKFPKS